MKSHSRVWTAFGILVLTASLGNALNRVDPITTPPPSHIIPRQGHHLRKRADVTVQPLPTEALKATKILEAHTKFITDLGGSTTSWIGPDPSFVAVTTITRKVEEHPDVVETGRQGVSVIKNAAGGLDILLSPAVKSKLEALAKEIPACPIAKRGVKMRQTPCGPGGLSQALKNDPELYLDFVEPVTDQVYAVENDSGYESGPGEIPEPGNEAQGLPDAVDANPQAGTLSDSSGWFQGSGEDTLETIVFGTPEEAAAIAAAAEAGSAGGILTTETLLGAMWAAIQAGAIDFVVSIPKENIHKITKPKEKKPDDNPTKTTSAPSSSSSACPTGTEVPDCPADCNETSSSLAKPTNAVEWLCSEGTNKGCICNPRQKQIPTYTNWKQRLQDFQDLQKFLDTNQRLLPVCEGGRSEVASEFFGPVIKSFCADFKKEIGSGAGVAFDIYGNKISPRRAKRDLLPPLPSYLLSSPANSDTLANKRSPPESDGPDAYKLFQFSLSWAPNKDANAACRKEIDPNNICESAFQRMSNAGCGLNQGSPRDRLFNEARLDIGCGEVSWKVSGGPSTPTIVPPPPPPPPPPNPVGPQRCFKPYPHTDVHENWVRDLADLLCGNWWKDKMWTNTTELSGFRVDNVSNLDLSWVPGCTDFKEQNGRMPLGDDGPNCFDLLVGSWQNCNNGGSGGQRQVGCLQYRMYAGQWGETGRLELMD